MERLKKKMDKFVEILISTVLAVMTLLVTWQVITRFVFKSPSTITEALSKYLFIWLVMIASAYVIGKREHMSLEFFVTRLSEKGQLVCGIISEIVILLFSLIVFAYGGGFIASRAMQQMDSALPIPVGIVYLALPICGVLSSFYAVANIAEIVKSLKNKQGGETL